MRIRMTARHFEMSEGTKEYVTEAMDGLGKYFERIVDRQAVITRESEERWNAELIVSVSGKTLTSHATEDLLFKAVDEATEKLERQLKKYKAKISHEKDLRNIRQENAAAVAEDAAT